MVTTADNVQYEALSAADRPAALLARSLGLAIRIARRPALTWALAT